MDIHNFKRLTEVAQELFGMCGVRGDGPTITGATADDWDKIYPTGTPRTLHD